MEEYEFEKKTLKKLKKFYAFARKANAKRVKNGETHLQEFGEQGFYVGDEFWEISHSGVSSIVYDVNIEEITLHDSIVIASRESTSGDTEEYGYLIDGNQNVEGCVKDIDRIICTNIQTGPLNGGRPIR
ncbi:MAG: hypothetical protein HOC44_07285 [Rhodospirillaceae bacterium]|mgnify:FL=1|nr:hypothetical protein [Rhodospirillaceae bacterium]MBT4745021.1 hypothetical protein [Rhodospirillaceae bacterium]